MNCKRLIVACLALSLITAAWLFTSASSKRPSLILLGYTNDVIGILTTSYESSNVAHSSFAIFRADNPTAGDFLCYIGPVIIGVQSNRMQHAQTGDFRLPAGESIMFAVPAPDVRGSWQCGLYLFPKRHLLRWQHELYQLAHRCGLYNIDKPGFIVSQEIQR